MSEANTALTKAIGQELPEPAGELVQFSEEEGFMVQYHKGPRHVLTNLAGEGEEADMLRLNAMGPAMNRLSVMVPMPPGTKVIEVQAFLLHPVKRIDEKTGEEFLGPRVVLIDPEGSTIVSSSKAIADMLAYACQVFKESPWNPPLRLECFRLKGQSGFDYIACRLLPRKQVKQDEPTKEKGKK